jgi:phage tail protein X
MENTQYIEYITHEGQRLDQIAHASYGDVNNWKPILDANPSLPISANLPAGLRLRVPVLSVAAVNDNALNLPPWKQ